MSSTPRFRNPPPGTATKAIIFDLDDTLIAEGKSVRLAFHETCRHAEERYGIAAARLEETIQLKARELWHTAPVHDYCFNIGISSWEALYGDFSGEAPELAILREWVPSYRSRAWSESLRHHGIDDEKLADRLASIFMLSRRSHHEVYADTHPCLEALAGSYPLVLLTNGAPAIQREKIESSGIGRYFLDILVSGEIGIGKPDVRVFQLALERLNSEPGVTWMVGDSLARDITGGQATGLHTAWMNRNNRPKDPVIIPEREVHSLAEFIDVLGESAEAS